MLPGGTQDRLLRMPVMYRDTAELARFGSTERVRAGGGRRKDQDSRHVTRVKGFTRSRRTTQYH